MYPAFLSDKMENPILEKTKHTLTASVLLWKFGSCVLNFSLETSCKGSCKMEQAALLVLFSGLFFSFG